MVQMLDRSPIALPASWTGRQHLFLTINTFTVPFSDECYGILGQSISVSHAFSSAVFLLGTLRLVCPVNGTTKRNIEMKLACT
jgi:hypothetical protein